MSLPVSAVYPTDRPLYRITLRSQVMLPIRLLRVAVVALAAAARRVRRPDAFRRPRSSNARSSATRCTRSTGAPPAIADAREPVRRAARAPTPTFDFDVAFDIDADREGHRAIPCAPSPARSPALVPTRVGLQTVTGSVRRRCAQRPTTRLRHDSTCDDHARARSSSSQLRRPRRGQCLYSLDGAVDLREVRRRQRRSRRRARSTSARSATRTAASARSCRTRSRRISMHDLRAGPRAARRAARRRCGAASALDALGPQLDRVRGARARAPRCSSRRSRSGRPRATPSTQEVARRKRAGENADELIAQGRALGDEIARLERELGDGRSGSSSAILLEVPNVTLPDVPARRRGRTTSSCASWGDAARVGRACGRTGRSAPRSGCSISSARAKVSGSGFVVLPRRRRAARARADELLPRRAHARARLRGGVAAACS